ncbi:MAG: tyrosine-type recombinase/integrase [Acidimicrobiales bacterium]
MPGSMRRRGTSWELRAYAGTDPETGKRRWVTATTKGTRRAVEQELAEFVARIDYPRRMTAEATVSKLLEDWYRAMSPNWSPTTARQTRSVIDCHLVPGLGDVRLQTLRAEHIDAFYGELRRGGGRNGEPLSPGTVHRVHVVLHRALAQALRWEWLWVNPAASASPPPCEPAPIYPPSPEEVVRLLATVAAVDLDFHTFLALAVSTGARRSQLGALRWGDIDLEQGQIGFVRALLDAKGGPVLRPTKTRRTYRVNLDRDCLELLIAHHARARQRADCSGVDIDRSSFVFSNEPDGATPWRPNWVTKRFITHRKAAKVDCRLHDLRHFMATTMLTAGIPIMTVSARLSHARTSTTLNVYAHAVPAGDTFAAEVLGGILDNARCALATSAEKLAS